MATYQCQKCKSDCGSWITENAYRCNDCKKVLCERCIKGLIYKDCTLCGAGDDSIEKL